MKIEKNVHTIILRVNWLLTRQYDVTAPPHHIMYSSAIFQLAWQMRLFILALAYAYIHRALEYMNVSLTFNDDISLWMSCAFLNEKCGFFYFKLYMYIMEFTVLPNSFNSLTRHHRHPLVDSSETKAIIYILNERRNVSAREKYSLFMKFFLCMLKTPHHNNENYLRQSRAESYEAWTWNFLGQGIFSKIIVCCCWRLKCFRSFLLVALAFFLGHNLCRIIVESTTACIKSEPTRVSRYYTF